MRLMARSTVVLPHPEGPTSAVTRLATKGKRHPAHGMDRAEVDGDVGQGHGGRGVVEQVHRPRSLRQDLLLDPGGDGRRRVRHFLLSAEMMHISEISWSAGRRRCGR